jgi:hypothetical protein
MAYSMSGSSETASNSRFQTSAFAQSRKRVTLFQWPNAAGRSRQGLPVRAIHNTASTKSRLFLPLRPGSPGFPRQCGSIFAHWASVKTKRSIRSLNNNQARMRILNPNLARGSFEMSVTQEGDRLTDGVRIEQKTGVPGRDRHMVGHAVDHAALHRDAAVIRPR